MALSKPIIYHAQAELPPSVTTIEAYEGAREELFFLRNPHFKKPMPEAQAALKTFLAEQTVPEVWVLYPEKNIAVHTVDEETYFTLRTSRNRNIIRAEEQAQYRAVKVGVAGLSVGSAVLHALVQSGGPKVLKIADFDTLEITNLNRIRGSLLDIGRSKAEIAAEQVWAIDPYAELSTYDQGVSAESLEPFIAGEPKLDVFIDEMDSIDLKILGRIIAKKHGIPVLMATDNGDGVIVDVERFDTEPEREIFHGLIGHMEPADVAQIDFKQWLQLATKIVGPEYLTERMQDSLVAIGKEIPAVPQLGTAASLSGAALAYAVRAIATKIELPSGRYTFGLEEVLVPGYNDPAAKERRAEKTKTFIEVFRQKGT